MLPEDDFEVGEAIKKISDKFDCTKVVDATTMNIKYCCGCKSCMFTTIGSCCLKDDFDKISKLIFEYKNIVVISGASLNFLDYKTMRFFERRFSFAIKLCEFRNQNIRHICQSDLFSFGVLYKGTPDKILLNEWLKLYTDHTGDTSFGAFPIDQVEELCECIL